MSDLAVLVQKRIDMGALQKWRSTHKSSMWFKFSDMQDHIRRNIGYYLSTEAGDLSPGSKILDLGTAFGYFPLICQLNGLDALGVDSEAPELREAWAILGVQDICKPLVVTALTPLAVPHRGEYSLITMMGVNYATEGQFWNWLEYDFLFNDLLDCLVPGGKIYLEVNWGKNTDFILNYSELQDRIGKRVTDTQIRQNQIVLRKKWHPDTT